jgi:serine protease Do
MRKRLCDSLSPTQLAIVWMWGVLLWSSAPAQTPQNYAALVRRVAPSVVTVIVEDKHVGAGALAAEQASAENGNDVGAAIRRLLTGSLGPPQNERPTGSLGSGFVIRGDGLIVTNRHVINAALKVRVRLPDGRELPAKILGSDAVTDIALLKVDVANLQALHLGSSQLVSVGDPVIAIGNPFGLGQSVSAGIISARSRTLEDDPYIDFLQTDAAINHGNSGGPLLSANGTVVGVTSAIFSPSGGSVGLGFAIPAETVSAVIGQIETKGHVERGYLGIGVQEITPLLAKALKMKTPAGALVSSVDAAGPARGTFVPGDVILTIGASRVTFRNLSKIMARLVPDSLVTITTFRSGKTEAVGLKIGRLPEPPADPALNGDQDTWVPALRLGVANTTEEIRKAIKATDEPNGLIVTQLRPAGAGALAGLKVGDLITQVGDRLLNDVLDTSHIAAPTPQAPVLVRMVRDGAATFIALTGESEP